MQKHIFIKAGVPQEAEGKAELAKKLMKYKVFLVEYVQALKEEELR